MSRFSLFTRDTKTCFTFDNVLLVVHLGHKIIFVTHKIHVDIITSLHLFLIEQFSYFCLLFCIGPKYQHQLVSTVHINRTTPIQGSLLWIKPSTYVLLWHFFLLMLSVHSLHDIRDIKAPLISIDNQHQPQTTVDYFGAITKHQIPSADLKRFESSGGWK